jgi:hypothetical protein
MTIESVEKTVAAPKPAPTPAAAPNEHVVNVAKDLKLLAEADEIMK